MKKIIILVFGLVYSLVSFAFTLENFVFIDGKTVCEQMPTTTQTEFSKWVTVPVDYKKPHGDKTQLYSYTKKKFNPLLPSLIYFVGGPGVSSRGIEFKLPNFNVIFFDQRGIACSRPDTKKIFLDPKFYSSENTAHDALLVLEAYGLKKASIFGHSYGTVPATIFASKYPQYTRSLLLEGVVYKADESLWGSSKISDYMEKYFYNLTPSRQEQILSLSNNSQMPNTWFSFIARMTMGVGNFPDGLNEFLENTVFGESSDLNESIRLLSGMVPKVDTTTIAEERGFGEITMAMISCQEMSMANPQLSHLHYFSDGHLTPERFNIDRVSMCEPLGLTENFNSFYSAENYPINVPVTYFLGELDPATPLQQGLDHYNNAQSTRKQALVMVNGGHAPNLEKLIEASYCDPEIENCDRYKQQILQSKIFEKASLGLKISPEDLQEFNSNGSAIWK